MSKGGMQTSGLNYSIYCPKCGEPAARMESIQNRERYLHFTKKGSVWHEIENAPTADDAAVSAKGRK